MKKGLEECIGHLTKALSSLPRDNASQDIRYYIKRALDTSKSLGTKQEKREERIKQENIRLSLSDAKFALNKMKQMEQEELEKLNKLQEKKPRIDSRMSGQDDLLID
jgi:hypothetical protein